MKLEGNKAEEFVDLNWIRLQLNALIDPLGRSIKPIHIKHWLEEYFGQPLEISQVQRDEIQLLQC